MIRSAAVLHHPYNEGAVALAHLLADELSQRGVDAPPTNVWSDEAAALVAAADLVVCVGGDGSVLRVARIVAGAKSLIFPVNMGRLGFLAETGPEEARDRLVQVLDGRSGHEERVMVRADVTVDGEDLVFHGLNDIVLSRQAPGRPIYVDVRIDGTRVANYRCDGMIVSTPTGSTGYSLSAGGPILAPTEHHLVVTPIAPHLALGRSLVLQPASEVELRVISDHGAIISVDGQEDLPLRTGTVVRSRVSEHTVRFATFEEPSSFYGHLAERLGLQLNSSMNNGRA